ITSRSWSVLGWSWAPSWWLSGFSSRRALGPPTRVCRRAPSPPTRKPAESGSSRLPLGSLPSAPRPAATATPFLALALPQDAFERTDRYGCAIDVTAHPLLSVAQTDPAAGSRRRRN